MSHVAIRTENLSKQFRIGPKQRGYTYKSLRDTITAGVRYSFDRTRQLFRSSDLVGRNGRPTIWALRDVSIEIKHGEAIGIIGRNGAGKTTLLKVISRITEPTRGFVEVQGRVGSLLEVGTGFHPELTGRENVFLNGAILGMSKAEIIRKFDEIVAFAEFEQFIDTPVKHYSSGMQARLAFAVAAHLETEILVVDEVLSVGDARFQRRCLNKMEDVGREGRTVLFVSHSMATITRLCQRVILLNEGALVEEGSAPKVVATYMTSGMRTIAAKEWPDPATAPGGDMARLRAARIRTRDGSIAEVVDIREPVALEMEFEVLKPGRILLPHWNVFNDEGIEIFRPLDLDPDWRQRPRPVGRYVCAVWIPGNFLSEGTVFPQPALVTLDPFSPQFWEKDAIAFQVVDTMDGTTARGDWAGQLGGAVRPKLEWTTKFEPAQPST